MSILGRHIPRRILLTAVLVLIVSGGVLVRALPVLWAPPSDIPSRDIVLVARGMAFYLESDPSIPNPTIHVKAGERVRIVLRNREAGMVHDFAVPAMPAALDPVPWNEDGEVAFTAPPTAGTYSYLCRPHAAMMNGVLVVDDF